MFKKQRCVRLQLGSRWRFAAWCVRSSSWARGKSSSPSCSPWRRTSRGEDQTKIHFQLIKVCLRHKTWAVLLCRLLLLEKGGEDFNALSQILTETCAALTYPLGKSFHHVFVFIVLWFTVTRSFIVMSVFLFFHPENKSYSSVRTEALSVVDLIVKRTGGEKLMFIFRVEISLQIFDVLRWNLVSDFHNPPGKNWLSF